MWTDRRFAGSNQVWLQPPKDAFVRVPDEILKTAVFLGRDTAKGREYGGTGYIVSWEFLRGEGGFTTEAQSTINASRYPLRFLVTAAHVAEKLDGFDFYVRANYRDGSLAEIKLDCSTVKWWYHPTERDAVDAALMILPLDTVESLDIVPIPVVMFARSDSIQQHNLGIGDEIFIAGLFKNAKGTAKNIPILRVGNVAMMPQEKILFRVREDEPEKPIHAYLGEVRSVGGLSGSPVFIRETIQTRWGYSIAGGPVGNAARFVSGPFWFFGSMIGHWEAPISFGDIKGELRNFGIAPIVPCEKILEILVQEELTLVMDEVHRKIQEHLQRENGTAILDDSFVCEKEPFTKDDFESALMKATRKTSEKK